MRYVMRQKMFSFGDDYVVRTADGDDAFIIDGKVFALSDQLSFQDLAGNELAYIRRRILSWGPTFEITRGGETLAIVRKRLFTLLRCRFSVDVPGPDDYEAAGSFTDHEYAFERGGATVATVSKRWFSFTDTYGVDIADGEDDVLLLASTVVIDLCCHGDRDD
jgi:uncharacterized protein YxjI